MDTDDTKKTIQVLHPEIALVFLHLLKVGFSKTRLFEDYALYAVQ